MRIEKACRGEDKRRREVEVSEEETTTTTTNNKRQVHQNLPKFLSVHIYTHFGTIQNEQHELRICELLCVFFLSLSLSSSLSLSLTHKHTNRHAKAKLQVKEQELRKIEMRV